MRSKRARIGRSSTAHRKRKFDKLRLEEYNCLCPAVSAGHGLLFLRAGRIIYMERVSVVSAPEKAVFKRVGRRELTALLYRPEGACLKNTPVCFWFHGGGWIAGDAREPELLPVLTGLMLDAGISVVSCEYRLADEDVHWRELVGDCSDFLRFFCGNSREFGLDMRRAFAGGVSAGGQLSLLEAFAGEEFGTGGKENFPEFRCVLDICGPVALGKALSARGSAQLKTFYRRFLGRDESAWEEIFRAVDPLAAAKRGGRARLSPVIAVQGSEDEFVEPEQPLLLKKLYGEWEKEFVLLPIKNGGHAFCVIPGLAPAEPDTETVQRMLFDFAAKHVL